MALYAVKYKDKLLQWTVHRYKDLCRNELMHSDTHNDRISFYINKPFMDLPGTIESEAAEKIGYNMVRVKVVEV